MHKDNGLQGGDSDDGNKDAGNNDGNDGNIIASWDYRSLSWCCRP